jgi:hypothetical protein
MSHGGVSEKASPIGEVGQMGAGHVSPAGFNESTCNTGPELVGRDESSWKIGVVGSVVVMLSGVVSR